MTLTNIRVFAEGSTVFLTMVHKQDNGKPTTRCRLLRINKRTGEKLVHTSCFGATLEWGRIEALGTVYQVEASKASELLQDLEYFDPLSNYGWLPEGVS